MNRVIICLLSLIVFSNCSFSNNSRESKENNQINNDTIRVNVANINIDSIKHKNIWITNIGFQIDTTLFIPDTSVNKVLFLFDYLSTEKIFGDIDKLVIRHHETDDFPDIYFLSSNQKEYLKMVLYPGSSKNEFSKFEIGYSSLLSNNVITNKSSFENFYTESGIRLGITKEELIKIKGEHYQKDNEIIKYFLYDNELGEDWACYTAFYYFKNNKLVKFSYGFEYP
jgi:hypothetical protein